MGRMYPLFLFMFVLLGLKHEILAQNGCGTGLGLSLAYDIMKAHGGEIKVTTTEYEGAEFTIVLPIISN